jgi:long-subunit fatty acid transport protein
VLSISGAVKLTSRLALGGSFNFWRGDWTEDRAISESPLESAGVSEFLTTSQTNRVRGNNFTLGLMLTYSRASVGLVYQNPLRADYTAHASGTRSGMPPDPGFTVDGELLFPRAFGLGGAWRPAPRWTVALDLTWDDWTEALVDNPVEGRVNFLDGLPPDRTSTRDTLSLNAGAERLFFGESFVIPLRFGAAWEPQGGRDPYTRDPVNFVMLAVGTGYNTNSLKFDAAFQYRWASYLSGGDFGRDPIQPGLPAAVGERSSTEWRLKLSLILRVTDTEKLRRTVHKVFGGS